MILSNKELLIKFLSGIETGDAMAAAVVDEQKYIQHNPETHEGGAGIAALFARISKTDPKVKFVRVFEDGEFAFAHNEYDFADVKIAFEVLRFEDGHAVEHWDNLQPVAEPNATGRSMIDGATEVTDIEKTELNRDIVSEFIETVLIGGKLKSLANYVDADLIQHAPEMADGILSLRSAVEPNDQSFPSRKYDTLHRVLAEGNFALCMCEGAKNGIHSGIYDLYRLDDLKIVEHWSTIEAIPPRDKWKNDNGKF